TGATATGAGPGAGAAAACPSVPRYAITSARVVALGNSTGIEVPGTFFVDEVRNASSVAASQVRWALTMAGVSLSMPGSVPDRRPMTAASDVPNPCFPGSVE